MTLKLFLVWLMITSQLDLSECRRLRLNMNVNCKPDGLMCNDDDDCCYGKCKFRFLSEICVSEKKSTSHPIDEPIMTIEAFSSTTAPKTKSCTIAPEMKSSKTVSEAKSSETILKSFSTVAPETETNDTALEAESTATAKE